MAYSKDERKKHSKPGLTPEQAKRKKKAVEQRKREADKKRDDAHREAARSHKKAVDAKARRLARERLPKSHPKHLKKRNPYWDAMPIDEITLRPDVKYDNIEKQHKKDLTGPLKINNPKRKKKK
jgi:hypothetical protein